MNVHNELIQWALDIGIVPAVLFFAMIVRSILSKKQILRNRIVLSMLLVHSLFDYDFQFISILFIMILFLDFDYGKIKYAKISLFSYIIIGGIGILIGAGGIICGISNFLYLKGDYKAAYSCGKINTMAQIKMLDNTDDMEVLESRAEELIQKNSHVPLAYGALAKVYYSEGNIEKYILFQMKAIQISPYQIDSYVEYINYLSLACTEYMNNDDIESAKICYERMEEVPDILSDVRNNTSSLAWKLKDKPQLQLPEEYDDLMLSLKEELYE